MDSCRVPETLLSSLQLWLRDKLARQPLWPGSWARNAAAMLRRDMEEAGLEYKTPEGFADFHALRHTAITRAGEVMSLPELRQFSRHSKVDTTMLYVHVDGETLQSKLDLLPALGHVAVETSSIVSREDDLTIGETPAALPCDRECDRPMAPDGQSSAPIVIAGDWTKNEITSARGGGYLSAVTIRQQRGRRGSNPQPPDRQSGALTN